jgi:hypothetical protein
MRAFVCGFIFFSQFLCVSDSPGTAGSSKSSYQLGLDCLKREAFDDAVSKFSDVIKENPNFTLAYILAIEGHLGLDLVSFQFDYVCINSETRLSCSQSSPFNFRLDISHET